MAGSLDRIDLKILRLLQNSGRLSNAELAETVGVSAATCHRRTQRLFDEGFVGEVRAMVAPRKVGKGALVMVGVVLDRSTPESFAAFERAIAKLKFVLDCHLVAGDFDYFLKIRVGDMEDFNRIHGDQLIALPGVRQTRTFFVMKEVVDMRRWIFEPSRASRAHHKTGAILPLTGPLADAHPHDSTDVPRRPFHAHSRQPGIMMRQCWHVFAVAISLVAAPSLAADDPDTIIFAMMPGKCSTLNVAGRAFACRAVAFFQTEEGRANFTVALDDPNDDSHIITFSGDNGRRPEANLYELPVDRMLLKSKDRPKADGLPVPSVESTAGLCKQVGNFVTMEVSSVSCTATDKNGKKYELKYESDGEPMSVRRIKRVRAGSAAVSPFD